MWGWLIATELSFLFPLSGLGIQFSNLFVPASQDDNLCLFYVIVCMLCSAKGFLMLAFYVDSVWPGPFGVSKPWYFPFLVGGCAKRYNCRIMYSFEFTRIASHSGAFLNRFIVWNPLENQLLSKACLFRLYGHFHTQFIFIDSGHFSLQTKCEILRHSYSPSCVMPISSLSHQVWRCV